MFNQNKIRTHSKKNSLGNITVSTLFIFTFLLIIFNKTDYILVNKIKSFSTDIISPITNIITIPLKVSNNAVISIKELRYLKQQNLFLKEEILRLKKWQTLALKNQRENKAYKKLLNSTNTSTKIIKTASAISQSPNIYIKTIIINAGSSDGITEDLTVINERGLVGKVISVTKNNSKILQINDQNSSVPVKTISESIPIHAILKGTSNGKYLVSSFIKGKKKPKIGDLLVTSSSSKNFPQDIVVGRVIKVNEENFIAIPYVDFEDLNLVQVINVF